MKIAMLGLGSQPIPPPARGAIESIIWAYTTGLRNRGHEVEILNVRPGRVALALPRLLARGGFDWIWVHHGRMVRWANLWGRLFGVDVVHTSHRPVTDLEGLDWDTVRRIRMGARARHQLALIPELLLTNRVLNLSCRVAHAPNGVETGAFRVAPQGNGRAICVGGISARKRQDQIARSLAGTGLVCDFVGPVDHPGPETARVEALPEYKGEWTGEMLRQGLTDYSVFVLYSRSEAAQPLVVGEALAAGLSVVLSPESARHLDRSLPFVTIVHREEEIAGAISAAAARNAELRPQIVDYARGTWDWAPKVAAVEERLLTWRAR